MHTLTPPETNAAPRPMLPSPEDMHYQGTMSPDILGRAAVLGYDYTAGRLAASERVVDAVTAKDEVVPYIGEDLSPIEQQLVQDENTAWKNYNSWQGAIVRIESDEIESRGPKKGSEKELANTREKLRDIDPNIWGKYFDKIFDDIAPSILKNSVDKWREQNGGIEGGAWLTWLGRDSTEQTDAELMNFLQWHNHRIEALQQSPEFQGTIEREREQYLAGVKAAEAEGWLTEGSFDRTSALLTSDQLLHFVGDEFDMALNGRLACAVPGKFTQYSDISNPDYPYVKNLQILRTKQLTDTVKDVSWHEFNHIWGWHGARWINEALTEHISLVLHGERTLEDVAAEGDGKSYEPERDLLTALITVTNNMLVGRNEKLSIRDFTLAYSNEYNKTKKTESVAYLNNIFKEAFDFPLSSCLDEYVKSKEDELKEQGIESRRERQRMALRSATEMLKERPEQLKQYAPKPTI